MGCEMANRAKSSDGGIGSTFAAEIAASILISSGEMYLATAVSQGHLVARLAPQHSNGAIAIGVADEGRHPQPKLRLRVTLMAVFGAFCPSDRSNEAPINFLMGIAFPRAGKRLHWG